MTLFVISLVFFMESLDGSIINTSIPVMAQSLNIEAIDLKLALVSYLLTLAIFIPISGWIADKYGAKKVFIYALILFILSSLGCGFSNSLNQMIFFRCMQGVGGAFGLPVGRLLVAKIFSQYQFIPAMSRIVMVGSLGLILGPLVGGFISEHFSWHWIFWINLPFGILAIVLAYYFLPQIKVKSVPPLDFLGFVLFGLSMSSFTAGIALMSETFVDPLVFISIIIGATILLWGYSVYSKTQTNPIIKTELLQLRTFKISFYGSIFMRLGIGGIPFLLPLFLQINLSYSPEDSGLMLTPMAIGVVMGKQFCKFYLLWLGFKKVLLINTILCALLICFLGLIQVNTHWTIIAALIFFYGFFISIQYTSMNSLAYAEINSDNISAASSMMSTMQQLTTSFGVSLSAGFIRLYSIWGVNGFDLTPNIFHLSFLSVGLISFIPVFIFKLLKANDGHQMIGE